MSNEWHDRWASKILTNDVGRIIGKVERHHMDGVYMAYVEGVFVGSFLNEASAMRFVEKGGKP